MKSGKVIINSTSAGGVVINTEGKVLVVNQKKTSWSLPKGHVNKDETKINAAKREIYEESGIKKLFLIKNLGSYQRYKLEKTGNEDKTELKTIHMFLFKTGQQKLKPIDSENPEARWTTPNQAKNLLTHPKDKLFFYKTYKAHLQYFKKR